MPRKGENITRRKDGRWEARVLKGYDLNGKAKYQSLYGKTYSEVRQKKDSYIRQGSCECEKSNGKKILFCEIAADYLVHIQNEIKESSFCRYRAIVQSHLLPFFGSRKIGEITTTAIDDFIADKRKQGKMASSS